MSVSLSIGTEDRRSGSLTAANQPTNQPSNQPSNTPRTTTAGSGAGLTEESQQVLRPVDFAGALLAALLQRAHVLLPLLLVEEDGGEGALEVRLQTRCHFRRAVHPPAVHVRLLVLEEDVIHGGLARQLDQLGQERGTERGEEGGGEMVDDCPESVGLLERVSCQPWGLLFRGFRL